MNYPGIALQKIIAILQRREPKNNFQRFLCLSLPMTDLWQSLKIQAITSLFKSPKCPRVKSLAFQTPGQFIVFFLL